MGWSTVYLVIAILAVIFGIWNLARQRSVFLSLTGIAWFFVVLLQFYIPTWYNALIIKGVPVVGSLLLYVLIPVFVILSFFSGGRR
jgi:hypothetical protein